MDFTCSRCGVTKPSTEYHRDKYKKRGFKSVCRTCVLQYYVHVDKAKRSEPLRAAAILKTARDSYYSHKDERDAAAGRYYTVPAGRAKKLVTSARNRAKQYGYDFDLSSSEIEDRLTVGVCEKSGIAFNLARPLNTFRNAFAPSLDRRNNEQGYTSDNVQVVCEMYNSGKGQHAELDFIAMCVAVAERHANDPAVQQRLRELRNAEF